MDRKILGVLVVMVGLILLVENIGRVSASAM